jgi:hypothetical protein
MILLLVLVAGSVLGVALDRRMTGRDLTAQDTVSGARPGEAAGRTNSAADSSRDRRRLIVEHVGLSRDQKAQVDSIVAHYRARMEELQDELETELRQAYQPRYRDLLERTRDDIKGILTPAQAVQYDSLLADYDRRREERHNRGPQTDSTG